MRKCSLVAVLLVAGPATLPLAAQDLSAVDAYVDRAPDRAARSVTTLAEYLAGAGPSDLERARAVFRWLARNIEYDVDGLRSGDYGDVSPEGVLRSGRAVCTGYAGLGVALGRAMGLDIEMVTGWSKGYGYTAGERFEGETNHAWNAVRVDGRWRLMDPTWGAGFLNRESRFERRFQPHYFLTDPATFVFDHLPENASWQLLDPPISPAAYGELVYLRPAFFANGLAVRSHDHVHIDAGDRVTVTLGAPKGVALAAVLVDAATGRDLDRSRTLVQLAGGEARIDAAFPSAGAYVLRVFAKPAEQEGPLGWALDYRVQAASGIPDGGFPTTFEAFVAREALLYGPMAGRLEEGRSYPFRLRVPGALQVAAVVDGRWTDLAREDGADDVFGADVVATGGELTVFARFDEGSSFTGLLRYGVR